MFINEIHTFVKFLKNQGQNIYHTPEQIDDAINRASLDLFRQEEKIFENQQIITDTLRPFKVKKSDYTAPGPFVLPENYVRATNISHVYTRQKVVAEQDASEFCDPELNNVDQADSPSNEREIDLIPDSDWIKRQDSLIVAPTEKSPIARVSDSQFEVIPNTVNPILYYLRLPKKAVWGYQVSQDGRSFIFDPSTSTDLEWTPISHSEIIEKTLLHLGVAVRDQVMIQYEQIQKSSNNEQ